MGQRPQYDRAQRGLRERFIRLSLRHAALEKFQQQLKGKLPKLPQQTALGRDAYIWFLRNVALMPFTPEELLAARISPDVAAAREGMVLYRKVGCPRCNRSRSSA